MRDISDFDILTIVVLYNAGPDHWHSHWERAFSNMRRVQQDEWDAPTYVDWADRLSEVVERCTKPILLVAHSLGTTLIMRWVHMAKVDDVAGAFLGGTH
jgi:predicted alpha/beta hydrolase family esterase